MKASQVIKSRHRSEDHLVGVLGLWESKLLRRNLRAIGSLGEATNRFFTVFPWAVGRRECQWGFFSAEQAQKALIAVFAYM